MIEPGSEFESRYYEIRIQGALDQRWSSWFNGSITTLDQAGGEAPISALTIHAPDQACLRGIMNKIWDLNLILLSVNRIDDLHQMKEDYDE